MVLESYDCLSSLLHAEGGTRRITIVANQSGRLQPRVDLLHQRLDIDLIVVDGVARCRIGVGVKRCLIRWKWERVLKDLFVFRAKPLFVARQSL